MLNANNIDNYMTRPIEEKLSYYHTVKIMITYEKEIIIYDNEDFDKAIERAYDEAIEDVSAFDYDYDIVGGGECSTYY